MDADHELALDAADAAYRRVSITQGIAYARDKEPRITMVSEIIDAYMATVSEGLGEPEGLTELEPQEAIMELLRANRQAGDRYGIGLGVLRGAPTHSGADLLNELRERGIVLARLGPEMVDG